MYNIKHLRGACDRMLNDSNTKNPIFLLLKAFSLFLLEAREENGELKILHQKFIDDAQNNYVEGWALYNFEQAELEKNIQKYHDIILTYNRALKPLLDSLNIHIHIRQHSLWLQNFNQQFLNGYDIYRHEHGVA